MQETTHIEKKTTNNEPKPSSKRRFPRWLKITLKTLLWTVVSLLLLLIGISIAFLFEGVQTKAARYAASLLTEKTGSEITIKRIKITFPLTVSFQEAMIKDHHGNPMLMAAYGKGTFSIPVLLYSGNLYFGSIYAEDGGANLCQYEGEKAVNIKIFVDNFKPKKKKKKKSKVKQLVTFAHIETKNCFFSFKKGNPEENTDYTMNYKDFRFDEITGTVDKFNIQGDSLWGNMNLAFVEKSGIELKHIQGDFVVSPTTIQGTNLQVQFNNSDVDCDFSFKYRDWDMLDDFLDSVQIKGQVRPSDVDFRDIRRFAAGIGRMNDVVHLKKATVEGTIAKFQVTDAEFSYKNNTSFKGNVSMQGLPDFWTTLMNISAESLTVTAADLNDFMLPDGSYFSFLPKGIDSLKQVSVKGEFAGFYNDFSFFVDGRSNLGKFSVDMVAHPDDATSTGAASIRDYDIYADVQDFNVGKLTAISWLGKTTATMSLKGKKDEKGFTYLDIDGNASSIYIQGAEVSHSDFNVRLLNNQLSGGLSVNDSKMALDLLGNIDLRNAKQYGYTFNTVVSKIKPVQLHLLSNRDTAATLAFVANVELVGNALDELEGNIDIQGLEYKESEKRCDVPYLNLRTSLSEPNPEGVPLRTLSLKSSLVDLTANGHYTFSKLVDDMWNNLTQYLPALASSNSSKITNLPASEIELQAQLKNTEQVFDMFLPSISLAPNSQLTAKLGRTGNAEYTLTTDYLNTSVVRLCGVRLSSGRTPRGAYSVRIPVDSITMGASGTLIKNVRMLALAAKDSVGYFLRWNNNDNQNKGTFTGKVSLERENRALDGVPHVDLTLGIDSAQMDIANEHWRIVPGEVLSNKRHATHINQLKIYTDSVKSVTIDGYVSQDPLQQLKIDLTEFAIGDLNFFFEQFGFVLGGNLNGTASLSNLLASPSLLCELRASDLEFNHTYIGGGDISSYWEQNDNRLHIESYLTNSTRRDLPMTRAQIEGIYIPDKKYLDFGVIFEQVGVYALSPYFQTITSQLNGTANGELTLKGYTDNYALSGIAKLNRAHFRPLILGTDYYSDDTIHFDKDGISFHQMVLTDDLGNNAILNGRINHHTFDNFAFDLSVNATNLRCLRTTQKDNESFYGDVFATGLLTVGGTLDEMKINADLRTNKQTNFKIPLNFAADVSNSDFITFVSQYEEGKTVSDEEQSKTEGSPTSQKTNNSTILFSLNIDATPDAQVEILMPNDIGKLSANGNGQLRLDIALANEMDMAMHGTYNINKGSFLLALSDLMNEEFEIRRGSSITWTGPVKDATINVLASHSTKASLSRLYDSTTTAANGMLQRTVTANSLLNINGKLMNPQVRFGLELPDAYTETKNMIFNLIDTTDEQAMIMQTLYLLMLGSFYNDQATENTVGEGLGLTFSNLLSGQVSHLLSSIVPVDFSIDYRGKDEVRGQEIQMQANKSLMQDRLQIETGVSIGGQSLDQVQEENNNKAYVNVNIGYKLTPDGRLMIWAFNYPTNHEYKETTSQYVQGMKIQYRRNFDRISELFRRRKKQSLTF